MGAEDLANRPPPPAAIRRAARSVRRVGGELLERRCTAALLTALCRARPPSRSERGRDVPRQARRMRREGGAPRSHGPHHHSWRHPCAVENAFQVCKMLLEPGPRRVFRLRHERPAIPAAGDALREPRRPQAPTPRMFETWFVHVARRPRPCGDATILDRQGRSNADATATCNATRVLVVATSSYDCPAVANALRWSSVMCHPIGTAIQRCPANRWHQRGYPDVSHGRTSES